MRAKLLATLLLLPTLAAAQPPRRNVILFVADGLRRASVTPEDMPTFFALRQHGVDFTNSHSVFPTFTTANASVIATGHGLGDTGDYSNVLYPGVWLTQPEFNASLGYTVPFLENDVILTNMNSAFNGNYLGEKTLLTAAREAGYHVASIGKLGPTAIQQIDTLRYDQQGKVEAANDAIIVDDTTGHAEGIPLPIDFRHTLEAAGLPLQAPFRNNGFADDSIYSNGFSGNATTSGTTSANNVQQSWFADVTTKAILPTFTAASDPFLILFWSRDPDGTQHYEGDSLQQLAPGINGPTSKLGLRNADRALKQLLDWLDANPKIKANTDVLVTSDHGFATISRREIAPDGTQSGEVSTALDYAPVVKEPSEPKGTLPTGFLAVDLAIRMHLRAYDPATRAPTGASAYKELTFESEHPDHPASGSALLGETVQRLDGSDAKLIIAANGGSDLIYIPSGSPELVHQTLVQLARFDYTGGLFVDDKYCPRLTDCPGALPLSAIGMMGSSKVPRPAIVITFKVFYKQPGDLQSAIQISDSTLNEGQGMHGGFGRDQTFNNMAAIGPDFKADTTDPLPMGNIDIVPTIARILNLTIPAVGKLQGRILTEALVSPKTIGKASPPEKVKTLISAPTEEGFRTILDTQREGTVTYYDRACFVPKTTTTCN